MFAAEISQVGVQVLDFFCMCNSGYLDKFYVHLGEKKALEVQLGES